MDFLRKGDILRSARNILFMCDNPSIRTSVLTQAFYFNTTNFTAFPQIQSDSKIRYFFRMEMLPKKNDVIYQT